MPASVAVPVLAAVLEAVAVQAVPPRRSIVLQPEQAGNLPAPREFEAVSVLAAVLAAAELLPEQELVLSVQGEQELALAAVQAAPVADILDVHSVQAGPSAEAVSASALRPSDSPVFL